MTCDVVKRKEAQSPEWTEQEVNLMEAEVRLARAKADADYVARYRYGGGPGRIKSMDAAEDKVRDAAHDRHVLRMFNERAADPEGFKQKIPLDDWMALHGHHIHDKAKT